mgnify:CR=1 FL=1
MHSCKKERNKKMRPNIWLTEDKTIEFIDKYINGIKDYDLAKYFNLSDRHVEKLIKIYIEDDVKKQVFENRYEEAAKYFKKDPKKYSAPKLAEIYCVPVKNLKNRLEDNGLRQKQTQSKVYTNEEFADIANKIHNNLYDYSEVEYKNNYTKVKIKCKIHGVFEQMPQNHLRPQGCPECAGFKKDTVIAKWTEEQKDQMVIEYTINGKTGKEIAEIFGGHENSVLRMLREERKCIMLTNKIPLEIAEVIIKEFQNSEKPNIEKISNQKN